MAFQSSLARPAALEARQFKVLTRHFFLRLFKNDLVDFEDQMKERVVGILSILAVFSGLISYVFLGKYEFTPDQGQSAFEKMLFITFFMLVLGFVAILEWDVMFPDKRDHANLNPLPLKIRTILLAKFTSLLLFVGLFALSLNILSSLSFVLLLPQWRSTSAFFFIGHALVHFLIMFLACFFGFFLYIVLLGFIQVLFGARSFAKASTYVRSLFLIIQAFLILTYLRILIYGLDNLIPTEQLRSDLPRLGRFFDFFPPYWFTDLYETALGHPRLPFHGQYRYALIGLAAMALVFALTMGLAYGRMIRKDDPGHKGRLRTVRLFWEAAFNGLFLKNLTQRAIFHFFRKTLKSSMFHRMRLATYMACGIALVPFLITMRSVRRGHLLGLNLTLVIIPLVLSFALLLGLRSVMSLPVSLESNWVFRLTERPKIRAYFTGLRKAILLMKLGPLFVLVFTVYAILWDPRTSLYHSLYGLVVSVVVMEVLFIHHMKIPFACSYLPGKEKIQIYWLPYILGFLAYVNIAGRIELQLLESPLGFLCFFGVCLISLAGIRAYQVFFLYKRNKIRFEEEPEPVMIDLDYERPSHRREI